MLVSDASRVKKTKWEETSSNLKSEIFLLLNLPPPQITLFFSLLLKTKTQHKEIKNAIWSFYFQVCGSNSFSSLAFTVINPVTSFPCWLWVADWQSAVCIHATLESGSNTAPDKQAQGIFPSRSSILNFLLPFLIIGPPRTEKCPPGDSNFPPFLFQLFFLPLLSNGPYLSPSAPFPCPHFL